MRKVNVTMEKNALKPKILHCSACRLKMHRAEVSVPIDKTICVRIPAFECPKCHKKYLGLEDAKRLDRAMIFKRAMSKDFKMTRNLSFDGDNYTFRIPKEFTHDVNKRKIEIIPLGAKEFCAVVE